MKNRFGDMKINQGKFGGNRKLGGHQERAVKNRSLLGKLGSGHEDVEDDVLK